MSTYHLLSISQFATPSLASSVFLFLYLFLPLSVSIPSSRSPFLLLQLIIHKRIKGNKLLSYFQIPLSGIGTLYVYSQAHYFSASKYYPKVHLPRSDGVQLFFCALHTPLSALSQCCSRLRITSASDLKSVSLF